MVFTVAGFPPRDSTQRRISSWSVVTFASRLCDLPAVVFRAVLFEGALLREVVFRVEVFLAVVFDEARFRGALFFFPIPLPGGGANQHSALSVAAGAHVTGIDFHTNDDPAVFSRFDQFEPQ